MGFFERFKNTQTIPVQLSIEHKRCTKCNRLLSKHTKKELCFSCDKQKTSLD